jgi:UDP-N-acetyl-D-glucosamine/UDP-N-acetyl-D-galactosamine dehydrogenase
VKKIIVAGKNILSSKVLVMGATFKEDVSDIRNSRVADLVCELKTYGIHVDVVDPYASSKEMQHEYGFELVEKPTDKYDAIIIAVSHKPYLELTESYFKSIASDKVVLVDVKGIYRNKIKELTYWSL